MSTNHILPLPKFVFALKIVQLVVAIVILGLAAYGVTFIAFDGDCLMLFTVCTPIHVIITLYNITSGSSSHHHRRLLYRCYHGAHIRLQLLGNSRS